MEGILRSIQAVTLYLVTAVPNELGEGGDSWVSCLLMPSGGEVGTGTNTLV